MTPPRPSDQNGLTSLADATREWWENRRGPGPPYRPPSEPVTPAWVLLGKDKPQYVIDEENEMVQCTCQQLGGTIYGSELPTTHRIGCELREHELRDLLVELSTGIADWASQEDGVPGRLWPHYKRACVLAGMPVQESEAA